MLVDLLSQDLAGWPDDAWIVIDDYHHLKESATAEAFVEGIVQQSPVQVLISTRERPELGLDPQRPVRRRARDRSEHARDERGGGRGPARRRARRNELRPARSRRRLAGRRRSREPDDERVAAAGRGPRASRAALRVLRRGGVSGFDAESRTGLGLLATAPSLDRELVAELLGAERAARVCAEALSLGVLEERDGRLEFHPLAAAFLERQGRRETTGDIEQIVARCLAAYRRRTEWDAAFDLVDRYGTADDFEALFSDALDALLNAGEARNRRDVDRAGQTPGSCPRRRSSWRRPNWLSERGSISAHRHSLSRRSVSPATDGRTRGGRRWSPEGPLIRGHERSPRSSSIGLRNASRIRRGTSEMRSGDN